MTIDNLNLIVEIQTSAYLFNAANEQIANLEIEKEVLIRRMNSLEETILQKGASIFKSNANGFLEIVVNPKPTKN